MKYIRTTLLSHFTVDKLYVFFLLGLVTATGELLIKGLAVLSGVIYAGLVVYEHKRRIRARVAREAEIIRDAEEAANPNSPAYKQRIRKITK